MMGFEEQAALERQKQVTRDEILEDGSKIVRDQFDAFLPDGVQKVRIIPGEDAENIREWANLAAREKRYVQERKERWLRDHKWTKVYVRNNKGQATSIRSEAGHDLLPFLYQDGDGLLFYYLDNKKVTRNLPEHLGLDIKPITDEISGRLAIMSASKNEEMIHNTLEKPSPTPYPTYVPRASVPLHEEDDGQ